MFLVDALAPMGLVAAGGNHADRGSVLPIPGTEEELSLLGEQRPLRLERGRTPETDSCISLIVIEG